MLAITRSFLRLGFAAALAASLLAFPAITKANGRNAASSPDDHDSAAAKPRPEDTSSAASAGPSLAHELREVKELLLAQQHRIEALEAELRATHAAPASASTAPPPSLDSPSATLAQSSASAQSPLEKRLDSVESKLKSLGPFSFSGDLRLRDEPFFGGPANQSLVRNRFRYRLRFNVNAKLNDDISGGFSLASGDINDPISTNQTANQFYTRKTFAIDRAFINYNPRYFKPLTLTGGKFAYPWYNTELTWDKDLNPEGLAQTLAWNFEKIPVLKRVALVGFELPFAEVAGVNVANRSVVQSALYGGQLQTTWQLASWLKLSAYSGFYNYHNPDSIAFALATASLSNPQTPGSGLLRLNQNSVQNSIVTTTRQSVVSRDVNGNPLPAPIATGTPTVVNAQFASKFGLFDNLARFDVSTPYAKWPVTIIGDYVQNTRACANVDNLPALGTTTTSSAVTTVTRNATCNSRERRAYWLEGRLGRAQEKGDWQFAYTRMFIEREAVLGAFNASDIRQNSNLSQHRVEAFYQAHRNVQLAFTGFFGRPLNFDSTAPPENLLKRLQFDVIYKF